MDWKNVPDQVRQVLEPYYQRPDRFVQFLHRKCHGVPDELDVQSRFVQDASQGCNLFLL